MSRIVCLANAMAVPVIPEGVDAFRSYLDRLLDLYSLVREDWVRFTYSARSIEVLIDLKAYPVVGDLKNAILTFGLREFSFEDVARVANDFFSRAVFLEDELGIDDLLWENVGFDPDVVSVQAHHRIGEDVSRVLGLLAFVKGVVAFGAPIHFAVSCGRTSGIDKVVVSGCAEICDGDSPVIAGLNFPLQVAESVPLVHSVSSIFQAMDVYELWSREPFDVAIRNAIRVAWFQDAVARGLAPDWRNVPRFSIGRAFVNTVETLGFTNQPGKVQRLIAAIVKTLSREPQGTHAIRRDAGGAAPQKTRETDKAWRRDIDYEYHLHYWDCGVRGPEFASVVVHSDLTIPE